ncbi:MAG: hypothetical protein HZA01_10725 [Nitrospinae bacterium]|nr:hypothetical protein [Nitrospinota bacterium]
MSPSISVIYKTTALSGDGRYIFFIGSGTINNCTVELNSATWMPDDYRWACPDWGDTYTGKANIPRVMRVSADNPSNKDELVEWWSDDLDTPDDRTGEFAGYYLADMETDHTGSLIVLSKSGSRFYEIREKGGPKLVLKLALQNNDLWGGISPDGKWMAYSENNKIVAASLDKKSKYSFKISNRFKLDKESGAEAFPLDISENASWLLAGGLVDWRKEGRRYQLATVRRNGSGFSPLPVYSYGGYHTELGVFHYDGKSMSDDGNSVAFIGRDKNKKMQLYVATRAGTCKASNLNQRASSNYDNLPEEARKIMEDECKTDDMKIIEITTLVEKWLNENIIGYGDLSGYIIPTLAVTKDLKRGYDVFSNLAYAPYIKTLSAELMESKLTSNLLEKMAGYCKNGDELCEKALLKKVLLLCSGAIAPPGKQTYKGLIDKAANKAYKTYAGVGETAKNEVRAEMASEILYAESFSVLGFFTEVGARIIDLIPAGRILNFIKHGYHLFSSADDAYRNMEAKDVRVKEYKYTSELDKKEYKITATVMRPPDQARLQIFMARSEKQADGKYKEDEKNIIFENWPISIATVKTIGKEEYLVFDGGSTPKEIFDNALKFFQGFEEKGYTKARNIDRYDYL